MNYTSLLRVIVLIPEGLLSPLVSKGVLENHDSYIIVVTRHNCMFHQMTA